jgi:hypothetical protein
MTTSDHPALMQFRQPASGGTAATAGARTATLLIRTYRTRFGQTAGCVLCSSTQLLASVQQLQVTMAHSGFTMGRHSEICNLSAS